jgi:lipopolysaccharide exporter
MSKFDLSYFRSTSILARGAFIGQVVNLAFYPIITRVFPPEAFGKYALLNSFVSVAAVGATLRYDMAIVSADTEIEGYHLLLSSVTFAMIVSFISAGLLWSFILYQRIGFGALPTYAVGLAFLAIAITSINGIVRIWNIRQLGYQTLSRVNMSQSAFRVLVCLGGGVISPFWFWLVGADLASRGYGLGYMLTRNWKHLASLHDNFTVAGAKSVLVAYKKFPLFSLPSTLIDTLAVTLPLPFIVSLYGAEGAGHFALAFQVLSVPGLFLSTSIAESFHGHLAESARNSREKLKGLFWQTAGILSLLGLVPFCMLFIWGKDLFSFAFGNTWSKSGELASLMSVWFFCGFVISPVTRAIFVLNAFLIKLVYDVIALGSMLAVFWYAKSHQYHLRECIGLLSVMEALAYVAYLLVLASAIHSKSEVN